MAAGTFFGIIVIALVIWWIVSNLKKKSERHLDSNGYYRDGYGDLIHRKVAYKHHYNYPYRHKKRYGEYQIHHIDENKTNNHPDNLEILTREQHRFRHGLGY